MSLIATLIHIWLSFLFVEFIFFLLSKWQTNKYNVIIMLGCASRCRWLCQVNVHEFYWNVKRRIFPHFRFLLLLFLFHSSQVGIVCIYFVSFCFKRVHNSLYTHYTYEYIYSKIALSPGLTGINNRHTVPCVCVYEVRTLSSLFASFFVPHCHTLFLEPFWVVCMHFLELDTHKLTRPELWLHRLFYTSSHYKKKEDDICKSSQVQVPSLLLLVISEYR